MLEAIDGRMQWHREAATLSSGPLRSEGGELIVWPRIVLGERCELYSEPINPPWTRLVWTSRIVSILGGPAGFVSSYTEDEPATPACLQARLTPLPE